MNLKFSKGVALVEHDIRPPMPISVTIPFDANGSRMREWCIYITYNSFSPKRPSDEEMMDVAEEIKRRLDKGGE